jgi:hypothetical protein
MHPTKEFPFRMSDVSDPTSHPASASKAESNRRNARKSTGPKTAQGKSRSRLNALKHGILASQAVLTAIEGREERLAFEQLVEGLAHDFAPVGTFEQVLVQQIAACLWRQRRLLMFENRTAFESRENRTYREMNEHERGLRPIYVVEGNRIEGVDLLDEAGLNLDLPSEADTMRLVRYEAAITRSLRNALAQLKARQQARRDGERADASHRAPSYEDRQVVVDGPARKRNGGPAAYRMPAKKALLAHGLRIEREEEEEEQARLQAEAAERASAGEDSGANSENDQTKPNIAEDPKALSRHQRLLEISDRVLKLGDSLAPKPRPSGE